MTEPQTPPPPLFIVPGRRAVIRSAVTYDALMTHWFADLRAMRRQLVSWYEPLRDSSESGDFGRAIDDAISTVERQWIATQGRGPTGPIDASAGPGGNTGHLFVPRARLWKGPLRVLLEQKTYGVLGRTLRTGTGAVLDPVPGPTPRMMEGGGTTPVPTNGTVVVMINGSPHELRQTGSGEVTAITEFLPGDVVEFPIFRILAIVKVQGMSRAVFNPMGSPFLGDTVAIVPEGQMPESAVRPRVRIHDNLIAMRFQLLLGLTRGAFSSFRETFTEPAHAAPRITENPADATRLPTGLDAARLQAMHDEEIRSYRGERADTELAQPATAAATPTELTTQQQRSLARRLVTLQGIRDDLDTLARRTNQKLEAWQAAVRTGQHVARSRREYRTAYQSWYSKLTRYFSLLDSATDRRERRGHHRRDATIGSNYNDKANHHDFTAEFGEKVFAHGVLYGGSLTNTAPVAYGSPYRYFNNHWGSSGPGVPPRITISKKGYVSMAELRNADSDRLTLGWVCTPSTLATSYFMLHSLRMRGGGSVRSQFDTHCSIYCSVDANLRQIAGAASRSRFFTYWPAGNRSNTGGPLGLPFDEHALEEFVGDSQRAAFRFLDSRTPYFEGRRNADGTEVATPPRHPGRVAPRDVPQSAFNAWRNRAPAPVGFPVALEQLRKYFLVDKGSQFTVISLGGHEYMQVWFMPHALLKNEPVVTANGQGTWASLYASARPPLDQASIAADTEAAHETFYFGAPPPVDNDNVTTYEGVSSEVSAEAMRAPPADTSSTTPDTTTGTGTDAAATQVQHGTHAEMTTVGAVQAQNRRNARTLAQQGRALSHRRETNMNDEDAVEDDHRGPDITTEELWEAALTAASAPTIGPTIGPPVAGFFAAYDPLTGAPHDVSGKGDLYGFEAQGNRIPVSLGALPGRFAGVHTTVLTGGPFRFEPVERITVLVSDFHPRYGTTMHVSRDRFGTPPDEEDQLVQCFTHFVLDEMRKAYANPISLEPIYLFKPGFDRMHAFTRGPLEPAQLLTPEQRLRAETSQTHFDVCLAELTAANAAYDAAAVAERSRVRAEGGVRPRDLEEHVRANPSEDMDAALLRIELAYQALEAASTRLFRDRPLAHPERAAISVSQAWYSDRAVPFPTFLETRDDEQYFRKSIVDGARRPVLARLQTLHGDQALLQALANADVPANAPDRDLEVLEEAERLFHTVGKAINLLNT